MSALELFHQDGKPAGIFYCSECRIVHLTKVQADRCHGQITCQCGRIVTERYYENCEECRRAENRRKEAERLEKAEIVSGYDGWIYTDAVNGTQDGFFESVSDLVEWCEENDGEDGEAIAIPEFAYCCNDKPPQRVDIDDVLEQMFTDSFEDAQDHAVETEPLRVALDTFWRANMHIVSYCPDYKRKVRVRSTAGPLRPTEDRKDAQTSSPVEDASNE